MVAARRGWETSPIRERYSSGEAVWAVRTGDDPRVAERVEIYACGVELSNGVGELIDAGEQRRRLGAEAPALRPRRLRIDAGDVVALVDQCGERRHSEIGCTKEGEAQGHVLLASFDGLRSRSDLWCAC